jgi:hypothetical protein
MEILPKSERYLVLVEPDSSIGGETRAHGIWRDDVQAWAFAARAEQDPSVFAAYVVKVRGKRIADLGRAS